MSYTCLATNGILIPLHILWMLVESSIKWPWAKLFEMNVKIEQGSDFVYDRCQLFFDAQEANKVSERTVV